MFEGSSTGNGNGNKMNLRVEILEGLLASLGEGKSAKVNSLKQTIRRNKTDMADDAVRSLDLMRQVFQSEMTDEFRQIIERHLRTTFSPALENLRRNGLEVTEEDIKCLCRSILEAAKKPFLCEKKVETFQEKGFESPNFPASTESDVDSEASVTNFVVHQRTTTTSVLPLRGRKRGRPPKTDNPGRTSSPYAHCSEMVAEQDLSKWNPDRLCSSSRFILASKVSRVLMLRSHWRIFMKYPSVFRYSSDEADRNWLIENRFTARLSGKIYVMLLEDAIEIAATEKLPNVAAGFERFAFCVPPSMILKMKQEMRKLSSQLRKRTAGFLQCSDAGPVVSFRSFRRGADFSVEYGMEQSIAEKYYHGFLSKRDIEPLLTHDGDFLIRKTDWKGKVILALAVCTKNGAKHFIINEDPSGQVYIEKFRKKSLNELLEWYLSTKTPLSEKSQAVLKNGIQRPNWLVKSKQVRMVKKLGEGAFGEVYFGEYTDENARVHMVAVKTMHEKASRTARLSFLKEARIMRKLNHPHIVRMYGIVADESPMLLLMELCAGGSALSFLRKHRGQILPKIKLRFIYESASGLEYLEQKNCIHRDVAARNCLLTASNHVKISDFGMSDEKTTIQDKSLDKVPIKWLAPETMQNRVYSIKSDVWSYGIMVWEVYSEGCEPYPSLSNIQTRAKIIVQNYRMEMPEGTPADVAAVVAKCWAKNPEDRPTFAKIHEQLRDMAEVTVSTESSSERE